MICIKEITFLTKSDAMLFLKNKDEFIQNFNEADIILRGIPKNDNTIDDLLEHFSQQALEWTSSEIERLRKIVGRIDECLGKLGFLFEFKNINFIKTTGNEEGGQVFYTRESSIIIAENRLSLSDDVLFSCISHELFHVFSKQNKHLRPKLYSLVGFIKCEKIILPKELYNNVITNPDGLDREYYYMLDDKEKTKFSPYICISNDSSDGTMFDRISVNMIKIKEVSNDRYIALLENDKPVCLDKLQLKLYKESIGGELIHNEHHPDEILADLFCYVVTKDKNNKEFLHPILKNVRNLLFME